MNRRTPISGGAAVSPFIDIMHYSLDKLFGVTGKVIVVTGASSGIGREVAIGLATLGAHVIAVGKSENKLALTRTEFAKREADALFFRADLTDEFEVTALADEVMHRHGRVDGLINAAGMTKICSLFDFDMADFRRIVDVNLMGSVLCCKAFGKHMVDAGKGRIVNFSSVRGLQGKPDYSAYAASKGAVNSFTRSLALELAPHGVNVNAVAPIFTLTDMNRESLAKPALHNWVMSRLPKGRLCETHELVGPVVFLLSAASDFVTGEILYVDGGWTAG